MNPRPWVYCPLCGKPVAVMTNGYLYQHNKEKGVRCESNAPLQWADDKRAHGNLPAPE